MLHLLGVPLYPHLDSAAPYLPPPPPLPTTPRSLFICLSVSVFVSVCMSSPLPFLVHLVVALLELVISQFCAVFFLLFYYNCYNCNYYNRYHCVECRFRITVCNSYQGQVVRQAIAPKPLSLVRKFSQSVRQSCSICVHINELRLKR